MVAINIKLILSLTFLIFSSTAVAAPRGNLLGDLLDLRTSNCPSNVFYLLSGLIPSSLITFLEPVLNDPPAFAVTVNTTANQPVCNPINNGTLLCCPEALSGDQQAVTLLSSCLKYPLNPSAINGFGCSVSPNGTCPGYKLPLCCQVLSLVSALGVGLWCQGTLVTLPSTCDLF